MFTDVHRPVSSKIGSEVFNFVRFVFSLSLVTGPCSHIIGMLLNVAVLLVLAKMPSESIKSPRQRPAGEAWGFLDYCTWQSWSRPLRMSSSHPYLSPNAPSSRLLAACHPEYRHERQQHTKSGRNGSAMPLYAVQSKPLLVSAWNASNKRGQTWPKRDHIRHIRLDLTAANPVLWDLQTS